MSSPTNNINVLPIKKTIPNSSNTKQIIEEVEAGINFVENIATEIIAIVSPQNLIIAETVQKLTEFIETEINELMGINNKEEAIQEKSAQEKPAQEKPAQEEPAQEEPAQEEPAQEEPIQEKDTITK